MGRIFVNGISTSISEGDSAEDLKELEEGSTEKTPLLPECRIDSSSTRGLKPKDINGEISFKDIHFAYQRGRMEQSSKISI